MIECLQVRNNTYICLLPAWKINQMIFNMIVTFVTQMDPKGFSSYGFNLNQKYAALIYEFKLCAVAEYVEDPHNK